MQRYCSNFGLKIVRFIVQTVKMYHVPQTVETKWKNEQLKKKKKANRSCMQVTHDHQQRRHETFRKRSLSWCD